MNAPVDCGPSRSLETSSYEWLGRVLTCFAKAEQAIGMLSIEVDLPIEKGALSNLAELQKRLVNVDDRRCKALNNRIKRWSSHRPLRHLLAHATLIELTDNSGEPVVVTRHLPRDKDDVTPDRLWSLAEQAEVLRQASSDSRSIADQVRNLTTDSALMAKLRAG